MTRLSFPQGFLWGTATSAQQIEGGRRAGGRGDSIWDRFAEVSDNIADGSHPDVACDHHRRWREDVALLARLGLTAYRFSIAWPRILPEGEGTVNQAGLDFYDALVDSLLEKGIEPFPTLYHWDLPQPLQERGGWAERSTAGAFADYAAAVAERLGDRVRRWTTHNEPWCAAVLGHEEGCHAPGLKDPALGLRAAHHMLLSHGLAVDAVRTASSRAELGIAQLYCPASPASDSAADHDAARWFDGFFNRWYMDPVFLASYPEDAVADRVARGHLPGPELPFVQPGDLEIISRPIDFLGLNYYSRSVQRAGRDGPEAVPQGERSDRTDMDWEVYPAGLSEGLLRVQRDWAPPAVYLTEFGCAFTDPLGAGGRIADRRRIEFLHAHLLEARRALAGGVPLKGCFVWSLLDNWEWALGYEKRFGLCAVEAETRRRIPKDSAFWYREVATGNAVPAEVDTPIRGETREVR